MSSKASGWMLVGSVSTGSGGVGAGEPDLVAGQGRQVLQQAAEAAVGPPGRVVLAGGLGLGPGRPAGRGHRAGRDGRVLVGEGQRRPGPAQVPGQVAAEHADQHVGPDASQTGSQRRTGPYARAVHCSEGHSLSAEAPAACTPKARQADVSLARRSPVPQSRTPQVLADPERNEFCICRDVPARHQANGTGEVRRSGGRRGDLAGGQLVCRNAPMVAMESSCVVIV